MADDNRDRIRRLFDLAIEIPQGSRAAFLDETCGGDDALRRRVEALLAADEQATGGPSAAPTTIRPPAALDGVKAVGPYRLTRKVGEGGMGIVWEAVQEHPVRRRVAVKLIKHGLDGSTVLARFSAERQALALMDHPNVARVLDAGSDGGGRPYFVMEYIPGIPIAEYCDRNNLSTADRLALMIQVCDGVQHAHQKGILHRDLKPGNILVEEHEGKPVPKIIDFGVAKAIDRPLTEKTLFTEFGQMVGTPEYMSPEQAEMGNLDVDTRSDVYSLGVLLYELLVGALPFEPRELRAAGYEGMRRKIREETPAKPSTRLATLGAASGEIARHRSSNPVTLARSCRGDLDWVTMKAIEKDRTRRYASASELAADLGRHLANEPVTAGPPSATYRARKFVRRHRVAVAGAAIVLLSLVAGLGGLTYGLVRTVRAERAARFEADTTSQISQFMLDMFEISSPSEARGRSVTAKEILDRAAERIRGEMADRPALRARLLEAMGKVYRSLGLYQEAQPLLESAVEGHAAAWGTDSVEVAATVVTLAGVLIKRGQYGESVPMLERAIAVERAKLSPGDVELSRALNNLGNAYRGLGRNGEALPLLEEALAVRERTFGLNHVDVAKQLISVGSVRSRLGDTSGARRDLERALSIYESSLGPTHPDVTGPLDGLASIARAANDLGGAEKMLQRVLTIKETNLGPDHPDVVVSLANLGIVLRMRGDLDESEKVLRRAFAIGEAATLEPGNRDMATVRRELGATLRALGREAEAVGVEEKSPELGSDGSG